MKRRREAALAALLEHPTVAVEPSIRVTRSAAVDGRQTRVSHVREHARRPFPPLAIQAARASPDAAREMLPQAVASQEVKQIHPSVS